MRKPRVGTGQKAAIKVPAYKKGRTVHSCPDMQASQAEPQSQQRLGFPFAPSRCPEALIAGTWDTVGRRCGGGELKTDLGVSIPRTIGAFRHGNNRGVTRASEVLPPSVAAAVDVQG